MLDRAALASSHNETESAKQPRRFPNLRNGGLLIAEKLRDREINDAIVLAIARGGVPVGHEVAVRMRLPFDLLLIKRLVQDGPGSQRCAVSVGGNLVLDEHIAVPASPSAPIEYFIADALKEFHRRERVCRGDRPPIEITGRKVLLIDCAIHTGSTVKIAIGAIRKLKPARIICAVPVASFTVPVASFKGYAFVDKLADEAICLAQPEPFGHAGMWYEDFSRPNDEHMRDLLNPN